MYFNEQFYYIFVSDTSNNKHYHFFIHIQLYYYFIFFSLDLQVAICVLAIGANAQIGHSGIVVPSGKNIQFSQDFANNIAVIGPSGIVTKDGRNLQLTAEQAALYMPATQQPTSHFVASHNNPAVGSSGIVRNDGRNIQFTHEFANNIVLIGPSGIVTRDGKNMQLRKKRSANYGALIGSSGFITPSGVPIQLDAGVTVVSAGPSGAVLSNGKNIQYRKKRSANFGALIGSSGFITPSGIPIQLAAGVTVVSAGPSGAVLSNGQNIQY